MSVVTCDLLHTFIDGLSTQTDDLITNCQESDPKKEEHMLIIFTSRIVLDNLIKYIFHVML